MKVHIKKNMAIVDYGRPLNDLSSKALLVAYLNASGRFWEYCNHASEDISDDQLIEKSLLYLEFEDMQQLFALFGYEKCKQVFEQNIKSKGSYYSNISFLLESLMFRNHGDVV